MADPPPVPPAPAPPRSSLRRDIFSGYLATAAKVLSWATVSALVYRVLGPADLAVLALVRATLGLLNYTTLGLAPAMIHRLAQTQTADPLPPIPPDPSRFLDYFSPSANSLASMYVNGLALTLLTTAAGGLICAGYAHWFDVISKVPAGAHLHSSAGFAFLMGLGILLRLASDPSSALLQVRGKIFLDNLLLAGGELVWAALVAVALLAPAGAGAGDFRRLDNVGAAFAICGCVLLFFRLMCAHHFLESRTLPWAGVNGATLWALLSFGLLVMLAQVADYLYAPTDYILINRLLNANALAAYVPAVQIDGAILTLVSGLAAVLLPKAALAHAAGDVPAIRRLYLFGTLASLCLLGSAALLVWAVSPLLLKAWLGRPMPATSTILSLVLIHTVVGGSSAVGRSILLGMGKVKPFTAAALLAGSANVVLSFVFVRYFHLGLTGIVLGTIAAVVGRCGIWMPWYVLRTIRRMDQPAEAPQS